jgi:endonuclease/exonuclease/phosphatase family metal-dependent hydrolase
MKIKIISLNVWEGQLLDRAIEFFKSEKADILLLQEVYGNNGLVGEDRFRTFEILKDSLGFLHANFVPGLRHRRNEGKFLQGNAILSRLPLLETDAVFFNDPFNNDFVDGPENNPNFPHVLQHAKITTPDGELNVFNLHGTWDLDGDNYSQKRQQMSQAIVKAVKDKPKVILAGDTNARPTNRAIQEIEKYLHSVFGHELKSTFNMKHKDDPGYATSAVDMVLVSSDIKVLNKTCSDVDISDHLPLIVELEI